MRYNRSKAYYTNQHSCFLLQYHLVMVTKYRHPVLTDEVSAALLSYTENYFKEREITLTALNTDIDHVHILFECSPCIQLDKFVNAFKSASSRHIRKTFPEFLAQYYWKPYFWSMSYFICTVSEKTNDIVKTYIENQGGK